MQKLELTIRRGATIDLPIMVESDELAYASITSIAQSAPVEIVATAHGIPDGWRAAVMNAVGMTDLNAENNPPRDRELRKVTVVDANTIEFNSVNAAGYRAHTANTGQLAYYAPFDLTPYISARMQVKDKVGGTALAVFATSGTGLDGLLEIDTTNKCVWLRLTAAESAALAFDSGVFDIELVRAGGVDALCAATSTLTVAPEVTTSE